LQHTGYYFRRSLAGAAVSGMAYVLFHFFWLLSLITRKPLAFISARLRYTPVYLRHKFISDIMKFTSCNSLRTTCLLFQNTVHHSSLIPLEFAVCYSIPTTSEQHALHFSIHSVCSVISTVKPFDSYSTLLPYRKRRSATSACCVCLQGLAFSTFEQADGFS
jgi:hypothetical protein